MNDAIAALAYYANMFHIYNKKNKKTTWPEKPWLGFRYNAA